MRSPAPQPRMPRVEDFPPTVQAEVEAQAGRAPDHEERGPMGLLKRLTNGLSRREEEPAKLQAAQPREPKLRQPAPEARRLAPQDPQLYAPRRSQLDEHGRAGAAAARGAGGGPAGDSGIPAAPGELIAATGCLIAVRAVAESGCPSTLKARNYEGLTHPCGGCARVTSGKKA